MAGRTPNVVTIGPCFVEMCVLCDSFPSQGEVIEGSRFSCSPAGAGAVRAIQAAFLGCSSYLVSKVGDDPFGKIMIDRLREAGVLTEGVYVANAMSTGASVTFVDRIGENTTCICPGANRALSADDLNYAGTEQILSEADVVHIHGSLPDAIVRAAIKSAKLHNKKVILEREMDVLAGNSAADLTLEKEFYLVDVLIPNFDRSLESHEINAGHVHKLKGLGSELAAAGIECVVIKLGARGTFVANKHEVSHIKGFEVDRVDRSCCGDAFAGALAAALGTGDTIDRVVRFAAAAGALSSSRIGGVDALPSREDILELLIEQPE